MKLYNSLTNKKEKFIPLIKDHVSMYVCGPTVYNYIHVGNARPIIVFDTLRRLFEYQGYQVNYISNFTDVDDKIIQAAQLEGVSEEVITNKFIAAFIEDRNALNALKPNHNPKVTDYMPEIIAFIELLIEKEMAYEVNGDVYFRIDKIENYGILSNFDKENLKVGARIEENTDKESPLDFTLWKKTDVGLNWEAPFSKGRPGWHTECVVMIESLNDGKMIDIHGGGMDLKFPHHENEIAQAQGCYHHNLANYWMHNGFINIDNEKMSKSLGNVIWVKDYIKEIGANVLRLAILSSHYRSPLSFSDALVTSSTKELTKIENVLKQAHLKLAITKTKTTSIDETIMNEFITILEDDLNTSGALTIIFNTTKELNQLLRNSNPDLDKIGSMYQTLIKMNEILGIIINLGKLEEEDIMEYQEWLDSKSAKDFSKADLLRDNLIEKGII